MALTKIDGKMIDSSQKCYVLARIATSRYFEGEILQYTNIEKNIGGAWSGTQFIAPRTGRYYINASLNATSATGDIMYLQILVNNGGNKSLVLASWKHTATGDEYATFGGSTIMMLNAGETVSIEGNGGSAARHSTNAYGSYIVISEL